VLAAGEVGYITSGTDAGKFKIGDGSTAWTSLVFAPAGAATTAITATNLASGAAGSLPYQTASGTTTTLPIGTTGKFLRVNAGATAPEWVQPGISALASSTSADLLGVISDETGSGNLVFNNSPDLVTPTVTSAGAILKGTSTGSTTLVSGLTGSTSYTITLPAETGTLLTAATAASTYVELAGDTMTGALNMGSNNITSTGTITGNVLKASALNTAGVVLNNASGQLSSTAGALPLANGGTGGTTLQSAREGLRFFVQATQPSSPVAGDLWFW
jgi:hypothetical protein